MKKRKTRSPAPVRARKPAASPKQKNSALRKAAQVLELVLAEDFGISAAELALRLEQPRQTVHRTVRALEQMGFINRALDRDRYEIGPTLVRLVNAFLIASYRRGPWRAILKTVVERTGESCNVAVLDGNEIIYIDRIECQSPLRVQLQVGGRVPAHCTAIGKLLLAFLPNATREKLLDNMLLARRTRQTIVSRKRLESELRTIRARGYAINQEEFINGIAAIAVPIVGENGAVIAGVAVHLPVVRVPAGGLTRFLPILGQAARQLSRLHQPKTRRIGRR